MSSGTSFTSSALSNIRRILTFMLFTYMTQKEGTKILTKKHSFFVKHFISTPYLFLNRINVMNLQVNIFCDFLAFSL